MASGRALRGLHLWPIVAVLAACSAPVLERSSDRNDGDDEAKHLNEDASSTTGYRDTEHSELDGTARLVAFPGGTSIALRWSTIGEDASGVDRYVVYRDGKEIATVTPGFHADFPEKDGKGYIDKAISAGASYEYRVQGVRGGKAADVGPAIRVTAPAQLSAPPKVQFDTSKAPDLAAHAEMAKAFLEIWYPKVAYALALPDYTPVYAYTIKYDPSYSGLANADWRVPLIRVNPQFPRDHQQELGMYLHESTHILDGFYTKSVPSWIDEGTADWTREYMLHDRDPKPIAPGEHYTQGYSQGSFFLNWIGETYDKPFVRTTTIAGYKDTYTPDIFVQQTGKSLGALWEELTGQKAAATGPLRWAKLGNKCVASVRGQAQVATCNGSDNQAWSRLEQSDGTISLKTAFDECLDVQSSGTTMGTPVGTYSCNSSGAQRWKAQADGTLLNPNSGLCLDDPDGSTVDGTPLRIWDCNGSMAQAFTLPP